MRDLSSTIIVIGLVLVVGGLAARAGLLDWLGRLPGDIRIENGNSRVFIPITTSIVLSLLLSLILSIFRR